MKNKNKLISIKGCREHNLKNISLSLQKNTIIAFVGVSGSGKSSLAFDTIFAEGQRRYLEYLSSQSRNLVKLMPKPDVDFIEGLSPTLAIGQGNQTLYSKGIVATYTDIYDFLALLFSKVGEQHSPTTGKKLVRYSRQEIVDLILKAYPLGAKIQLLAPIKWQHEGVEKTLQRLQKIGFIRFKINGLDWQTEDPLPSFDSISEIDVIVDRLEMKEDVRVRLSNSIDTAMDLSQGILKIQEGKNGPIQYFTEIYVCPESSLSFPPLTPSDFNFNSPHGACPICKGVGGKGSIQPQLIEWDKHSPLSEQVHQILDLLPKKYGNPWHAIWDQFAEVGKMNEESPFDSFPAKLIQEIIEGSSKKLILKSTIENEERESVHYWKGLVSIFEHALKDKKVKNELINDIYFVKWQICPACHGYRLKPESLSCLIHGLGIHQICLMTVSEALHEITNWHFDGKASIIAEEIIPPILSRLHFLDQVGLGYLELNREGNSLSTGEIQRIQLASQIGAKLSGIIYVLDEPSMGLHKQDIQHLFKVISELKELGNTVVLVEHDSFLIKQADSIIELGPGAGLHGGLITFQGDYEEIITDSNSITGQWLSGKLKLPTPPKRKTAREKLKVNHASLHNLKDVSIEIPLNCLVGFCGVSGSGKSTLVNDIIGEEIRKKLNGINSTNTVSGISSIKRLVTSEKQNFSFSSRSIPATFIDVMTPLRNLFAETKLAKARGYTPSRFSLNKKGGRCEACEGFGQIRVSMEFMPDIFIPCDVCQGQRYNYETLQITWEGLNISQVLNLSIEEAFKIFQFIPAIGDKLEFMKDLGLEYLTLGQPFNTLSSGEIQRLRLVADIATKTLEKTLYILDEPSSGLHFQDISKLVQILHRLVEKGHSVFIIEHHTNMLAQTDWLIELGPEGGPKGGHIIFEGTPKQIQTANTPTGKILQL